MNRLFQHYEGEISKIQGKKVKSLTSLIDDESKSENVILLWLEIENSWLRIFIDGTYCGVDEYESNESENDLDDGVSFQNYDEMIRDLEIKEAKVISGNLPLITLSIEFTDESLMILNCDEYENCKLKINAGKQCG